MSALLEVVEQLPHSKKYITVFSHFLEEKPSKAGFLRKVTSIATREKRVTIQACLGVSELSAHVTEARRYGDCEELMEQNIRFVYVTRDGVEHPVNIAGVNSILDAAFEIASSIMNGDLRIDPRDIVKIIDIPG
jgi:hypothetical protein